MNLMDPTLIRTNALPSMSQVHIPTSQQVFVSDLIAFITSLFQGGSMWDEGSGTGGYIWLMFLTLPVGFLLVVIGLVMMIVRRRR